MDPEPVATKVDEDVPKKESGTSTTELFQVIGWVLLSIFCSVFVVFMSWLFTKNRDAFLFIVSLMMTIASVMIFGAILHQKNHLQEIPFKMTIALSSILSLVNLLNFILFLFRYMRYVKEKKELLQMPGLMPRSSAEPQRY